MYLIFPVIVIVTVTVLLQCLSCSSLDRTRRQTLLICIMTVTMTMTKNKIQNRSLRIKNIAVEEKNSKNSSDFWQMLLDIFKCRHDIEH